MKSKGEEKGLEEIVEEIKRCEFCDEKKIGLIVPGEGPCDAKIMFIGEAPGPNESKTGRPFVGRSGNFLNGLMKSIGLKREEVYLTSPVKYYPGKRVLKNLEILHGREHLLKQIEAIKPKILVLLGNVAIKALFPEEKFFASKVHGKILKKDGRTYFFTFHPAAAMRFPKIRKLMEEDFKKLRRLIYETVG